MNLLTAGEDPTRVGILRRYLEHKGIEMNDRDTMIDSLLDWVSPNKGLHRLNAPPESDDYHPAHAPLTSVDELKKVFGWTEFTSKLGWDEDFTINSSGPIDLAWASRDVEGFAAAEASVDPAPCSPSGTPAPARHRSG